jgi:hypothetical protein
MTSLAVTAKGQITLKRDLLHYLGIKPGERVEVEELPGGQLRLRAARPQASIDNFCGLLAGKSAKVASIAEINEAAASGWADAE